MDQSAIGWVSLVLGGVTEVSRIIAEFNRNGVANPTLEQVMAKHQQVSASHANFQAALAAMIARQ